MTNFAKFGSDEPLEGGSTAIFACNHAKSLSSMFFDQMPTFLTPGKVIGNKKVFSLHPTVQPWRIAEEISPDNFLHVLLNITIMYHM